VRHVHLVRETWLVCLAVRNVHFSKMWQRVAFTTVTFVVPLTSTTLNLFGYIAQVEGVSMQPVLNPDDEVTKDFVFLNRWSARHFSFERGQIVTLTCPRNPEQQIIKRIVAVEGDCVRSLQQVKGVSIRPLVHVPRGHCWLEGDRHDCSMDSNVFGPVPVGLINAKVSHIAWPPRRWRRLDVTAPSGRLCSTSDCTAYSLSSST